MCKFPSVYIIFIDLYLAVWNCPKYPVEMICMNAIQVRISYKSILLLSCLTHIDLYNSFQLWVL